jgi:plastocyanin
LERTVWKENTLRIHIASTVGVIVLASFFACGKDSSNPVTPPPTRDHFKVVQMQDTLFSPKDLVVSVGDTVEWVNVENNSHTSTSGPGSWAACSRIRGPARPRA